MSLCIYEINDSFEFSKYFCIYVSVKKSTKQIKTNNINTHKTCPESHMDKKVQTY